MSFEYDFDSYQLDRLATQLAEMTMRTANPEDPIVNWTGMHPMITQSVALPSSPVSFGSVGTLPMSTRSPSLISQLSPQFDFDIFRQQLTQPLWGAFHGSDEIPALGRFTFAEPVRTGRQQKSAFSQSRLPEHDRKVFAEEAALLKEALAGTRRKRYVPPGYICHNCYVPNHHNIKDCPNPLPADMRLTPYQGTGTCIGEFQCPKCKRGWLSHKSESNTAESCRKCNIQVYPFKQHSPEQAIKARLYDKPKYRNYGEKFGTPFVRQGRR